MFCDALEEIGHVYVRENALKTNQAIYHGVLVWVQDNRRYEETKNFLEKFTGIERKKSKQDILFEKLADLGVPPVEINKIIIETFGAKTVYSPYIIVFETEEAYILNFEILQENHSFYGLAHENIRRVINLEDVVDVQFSGSESKGYFVALPQENYILIESDQVETRGVLQGYFKPKVSAYDASRPSIVDFTTFEQGRILAKSHYLETLPLDSIPREIPDADAPAEHFTHYDEKSGTVYRGNVSHGQRQGEGVMIELETRIIKRGVFRKGELLHGEVNYPSGHQKYMKYRGSYNDDGLRHGFGRLRFINARCYKGNFTNGVPCEFGILFQSPVFYKGIFVKGKKENKFEVLKNGSLRCADIAMFANDNQVERNAGVYALVIQIERFGCILELHYNKFGMLTEIKNVKKKD